MSTLLTSSLVSPPLCFSSVSHPWPMSTLKTRCLKYLDPFDFLNGCSLITTYISVLLMLQQNTDQKQLGKERIHLPYRLECVIKGSKAETQGRSSIRDHGGTCFLACFPWLSQLLFSKGQAHLLGWCLPQQVLQDWSGQSDGENSLIERPLLPGMSKFVPGRPKN